MKDKDNCDYQSIKAEQNALIAKMSSDLAHARWWIGYLSDHLGARGSKLLALLMAAPEN